MRLIPFLLFFLFSASAFGALSPRVQEWGAGPTQWIMTSDEKRAWRKVATDSDAVNFIDLFWARRDPSSGTPTNEYRNEFESRVAFADERFTEKRKRGAMTDRGRVYIVLGAATNMNSQVGQNDAQQNIGDGVGESMRQRGSRDVWLWEHADAQKFGMPKIEVVFVQDPVTGRVQRDTMRNDFGLAEARALKQAVVSPQLTALPEWAAIGGLEPKGRVITVEVPMPVRTSSAQLPPMVASTTPGASRLTFLRSGSIDAQAATDPFAAVQSDSTFPGGRDVRWAVQYCSPNAQAPRLKHMLFMQGPLDGKAAELKTKEKEESPQLMRAIPGCYVLQGMVPVSKLASGHYKVSVFIDDVATKDSYTAKGEFRVE
jgi:GWxTD domain-containing protein